jgi:hypothetical protein
MASPQQKVAAANIRDAYLEKNIRYAILTARCQSGKTGAFHELIRLMLESGSIQRVYVLCGSNEVELREQANKDAEAANPAAFTTGESKVLFRQDFKGSKMNITNALIVVDESHLDQTQGQELDAFLGAHRLSMDGNPMTLEKENTYILSVDATPYSELAALAHKESFPKHVEVLIPGDEYFGLADYKYSGLMHETFDISKNPTKFAQLFARHPSSPKWALVRLSASKAGAAQEAAIMAMGRLYGFKVRHFDTSTKKQVSVEKFLRPPKKNTVVIVYGRLRAGKVVPKEHISFVWEGAKSSKTDSLVQGLPGRMCGYKFGDMKPLIFVPPSSLKTFSNKVIKASEIERAIMEYPYVLPTKATNITKPRVANIPDNGKTQCVPLRFTDTEDDDAYSPFADEDVNDAKREFCRELLLKNTEMINSSKNYSDSQKNEIISYAASAFIHIRHFDPSGEEGMRLKGVIEAYKNNTATNDNIYEGAQITFIFTRKSRSGAMMAGANHKHIYVIFHTNASNDVSPGIEAVHLNSRIPKTNDKSIFSIRDNQTDVPLAAGGVVGFDEERIKNPTGFESAIRDYLMLWKSSTLTVSRCIQSVKERFTLSKKAFHWESKNKSDIDLILKRLSSEFEIKMNCKYARSSETHFNLKTITW